MEKFYKSMTFAKCMFQTAYIGAIFPYCAWTVIRNSLDSKTNKLTSNLESLSTTIGGFIGLSLLSMQAKHYYDSPNNLLLPIATNSISIAYETGRLMFQGRINKINKEKIVISNIEDLEKKVEAN